MQAAQDLPSGLLPLVAAVHVRHRPWPSGLRPPKKEQLSTVSCGLYLQERPFVRNGRTPNSSADLQGANGAEDATQETPLRAFQNLDRFRNLDRFGEGDFGAWLMRIANNVRIDPWRGQRRHAETTEESLASPLISEIVVQELRYWNSCTA